MSLHLMTRSTVLAGCLAAMMAAAAQAGDSAEETFQRGYFLQQHDRNLSGAAAAFEKVAADPAAPPQLREEAKHRLAQCREDLATMDFARLMPPGALAYVEISNPGEHLGRLVEMLGLLRDPDAAPAAPAGKGTALGEGLYFPDDFTISPALISELKKFRGAAAAVTAVDPRRGPEGVLVLHPGDSDLLRGVMETAAQCLEPVDAVAGFRTYRFENEAWLTITNRLLIASRKREQLSAVIGRLNDPNAPSLAAQEGFEGHQGDRQDALLFAFVNVAPLQEMLGTQLRGQEAAIARTVMDLQHLRSVTAVVGTTEQSIHVQAKLDLMEGHTNLLYGMIRTAPLSRRSLDHVPPGAVGLVLLGLNPAGAPAVQQEQSDAAQYITAMDIGREIFGNMEEIALFALPPGGDAAPGRPPLPEMGAVVTVKDAAKSEALWSQLLALPALMGETTPAQDITVNGAAGKVYQFPDAPPIVLVRSPKQAIVVGTHGAAAAAMQAQQTGQSVGTDAAFRPLLERLTPNSSKAVLVHVGRVIPMVAGMSRGRDAEELTLMSQLLSDLRVSLVTDEQPTQFVVRGEASGLPQVPEVLKRVVFARRQFQQRAARIQLREARAARARAVQEAQKKKPAEDGS